MDQVRWILGELLSSKKFVALLVGLLATGLAKLGLEGEAGNQLAQAVVVLVSTYLLGQGVADHGKERARVELEDTKAHLTHLEIQDALARAAIPDPSRN